MAEVASHFTMRSSGTRIFIAKGEPWDNRMQSGSWLFTHAGNAFDFGSGRLSYRSEAGNDFEIWRQSTNLPKVDAHVVELNPALTYDSPYLHGVHGEDQVSLRYPGMPSQILDFHY
jgi:hypothetical protein